MLTNVGLLYFSRHLSAVCNLPLPGKLFSKQQKECVVYSLLYIFDVNKCGFIVFQSSFVCSL